MELRLCRKCKIEKPLSEFCKRKCEKDGLQKWCRICNRAAGKKWRIDNPEKERIHSGRWRKKHREVEVKIKRRLRRIYRIKWLKIITDRKMDYCSVCGYNKCKAAIHFHHVNVSEKINGIAYCFQHPPTTERLKELDKCIALCANCHYELHDKLRKAGDLEPVRENRWAWK